MEEKLSLDETIIAEKTVCILLVSGESEDGEPIYAYVAVRGDRLQEFMAAQSNDTFYPEDHGVIIEAGEGEPSEEVRRRMSEEYNFNHEALIGIPDTATAYRLAANITETMSPTTLD